MTASDSLERADLTETLSKHRGFLRQTVAGLSDDQARLTPTVSALCLGGILKHVTLMEKGWVDFIEEGPRSMEPSNEVYESHTAGFRMLDDESLARLLADYEQAAQRTDNLVASIGSLDLAQPLPEAPWFPPGARWSARRVFIHIIAETSQHAGHADIIRETIDGAKTMG